VNYVRTFMCFCNHVIYVCTRTQIAANKKPRSRTSGTTGSVQLSRCRWGVGTCLAMFNTQHFSIEMASCHSLAHSTRDVKASCECEYTISTSLIMLRYIFTSYANIFTLILCCSSKYNQFIDVHQEHKKANATPLHDTTAQHGSIRQSSSDLSLVYVTTKEIN